MYFQFIRAILAEFLRTFFYPDQILHLIFLGKKERGVAFSKILILR